MKENKIAEQVPVKLGFIGLTALVFGMVVGAGIFNIPQNMAHEAGLGAVLVSWLITAVGILLLVATFKILADRHPEYDAGIYQYARDGYGRYSGFNVALGYWLCTCFANIAYAVMLNDTFGTFFPKLLDHGFPTVIFGSVLIWAIYFVVIRGMRTARALTIALSLIKILAILLIIVLLVANSKIGMFSYDFWGRLTDLGGFAGQVKSTMLVTLWCFIGIEGAVMMSGRARRNTDIGRAGVTGFLVSWLLYVMVSIFSFGVMTQPELAALEDPSVAYVLRYVCGDWAYYIVMASIIICLLGGWVAWSLVCGEVPYTAAKVGIFPKKFMRLNSREMPAYGLFISSIIMQLFLLIVTMDDNVYLAAISITGMMILPAYLVSGMFLLKISLRPGGLCTNNKQNILKCRVTAVLCTIFCAWMIYAGGLDLFMKTSLFYLAGFIFYYQAWRDHREENIQLLTTGERWGLLFIVLCAIGSAFVIWNEM